MHRIKVQLGDWSNDGHGQTKDYIVESSVPLQQLREYYFQACEEHFDISKLCEDYGDSRMTDSDLELFEEAGIRIHPELKKEILEDGEAYIDTDQYMDLWVRFMENQDERISLRIVPEEEMPTFHFYGYDEKQRHIGGFGYGIFGD